MPILDPNSFEFFSRSPEQTRRVGMRLGGLLHLGDMLCLSGDLGSGKTTFVQGLAAGWGSLDPVSSPSFVLVNVYRRGDGQKLAHLDAYRLNGPAEAEALDLDELLGAGPLVVEWAPRVRAALPEDCLDIRMDWVEEEHRQVVFSARGARPLELLEALQADMFGAL
jgi:tRNA threonylcarbamoyladenosine biosynthesis protein TsaE